MSVVQRGQRKASNMRKPKYPRAITFYGKTSKKSVCNRCKKYFVTGDRAYSTTPGAYRHVNCGVV
jgi:hypothetical protein